jgi:hypothetical protein
VFHSKQFITIQKKDLFLFNTNYQSLFGFLTPKGAYYQLSASQFLENFGRNFLIGIDDDL